MKKLKLDLWEDFSSTLTRKLDRVIIVNIAPPTRLLKSLHKSRTRPGKSCVAHNLRLWRFGETFVSINCKSVDCRNGTQDEVRDPRQVLARPTWVADRGWIRRKRKPKKS